MAARKKIVATEASTSTSAAPKKQARPKKKKLVVYRGKRKQAIARAWLRPAAQPGRGVVRINGLALAALHSPVERAVISEPIAIIPDASKFDIYVSVRGGGRMGQAQAARTAISRALVAALGDEELKKRLVEFDRSLLVEDTRRVEPKKFKGPGARARFTKSYR
ncbi:MAG: 30S ribosomal protein S9 [Candidatus Norongarragalinales archaeon]